MTIITQDGRKLDAENFVRYGGSRHEFFAGDTGHPALHLATYGHWLIGEFIHADLADAFARGDDEYKMPPYMSTLKEYHNYMATKREATV